MGPSTGYRLFDLVENAGYSPSKSLGGHREGILIPAAGIRPIEPARSRMGAPSLLAVDNFSSLTLLFPGIGQWEVTKAGKTAWSAVIPDIISLKQGDFDGK